MNKSIKNPFERLQKGAVSILCIVCALFVWSCQNKSENDQTLSDETLSDEEISINLLIEGEVDPESLIGEWDCIKFAYTADGKEISNVVTISSRGAVSIFDEDPHLSSYDDGILGPFSYMYCNFFFSVSDNLISLSELTYYYQILVQYNDDEMNVIKAFQNAYSFVIKGNELIIYFTGEKNKNLLILKKR